MEFTAPNKINFKRGKIFCKGEFFELSDKGLVYNGKNMDMQFLNGTINSPIGIVLDDEFKDFNLNGGFFLQVPKE